MGIDPELKADYSNLQRSISSLIFGLINASAISKLSNQEKIRMLQEGLEQVESYMEECLGYDPYGEEGLELDSDD